MPRAGAKKHIVRRRFKRIRQEILAYSVPRQGVRRRRSSAETAAEYGEARRRLAYRNATRQARRRPPVHARPLKKKRPWWSWFILDYQGFTADRDIARGRRVARRAGLR